MSIQIPQPEALYNLPRIGVINDMPDDVAPFLAYISADEQSPEMYLLEILKTHKIVINGEYHRRKVSWDMLKRLIALPDFSDAVGCIFMELFINRHKIHILIEISASYGLLFHYCISHEE